MKSNQNFQQHIHVFRALAIILIVCAHTLPSLDWSASPVLGRAIDGLANESSIFFFFIAGYLFQFLSSRFSYPVYLKQKLKTVILPYLILSIPAVVIFTLFAERTGMWSWFYDLEVWAQVVLFLLTGKHLAPLWFVPTIAMFYLLAPLFLWIDRSAPKLYWVIIPLLIFSSFHGRDGPYGPIDKGIYLLPIYLMGMVFCHHQKLAEQLVLRNWIVLSLVVLVGYFGFLLNWEEPPFYLMIMKAPMALLMTVLLLRNYQRFGSRLDYVAEISFGIFFVHAYFISFLKIVTTYVQSGQLYMGDGGYLIVGNGINFFLYVFSVLLFSVVSIWVVQKVLGKRSRMVIGA
jgi:probable poly-beta-1,6-N-acetyl-D-glucosamine export protein